MFDRRRFLANGFAAVAAGMSSRTLAGCFCMPMVRSSALGGSLGGSDPFAKIVIDGAPQLIDDIPFVPQWFGDTFPKNQLPFHQCESCDPAALPDESVEIAIIGGGLSGLASAYMLRDRKPVLFELHPRFGGNAMGEIWSDADGAGAEAIPYSLGSAYFITPDRGSRLESLYRELGVMDRARIDTGPYVFELSGSVTQDPCVQGCDPQQQAAVAAYQKLVQHFANERYPEIPLPPRDDAWIRELDRVSLKQFLDAKVGPHLPTAYAAAIQAYCYSSFGIGWDELSAAAGWNFIAAEEFGRVVLPGGNAALAHALWSKLAALDDAHFMLRASCMVVSVELAGSHVIVRWRDAKGTQRTMKAKHVIMANAKQIVERMIVDIGRVDAEKANALPSVQTVPYLVANVLLKKPLATDQYDVFLLHDHRFPMNSAEFEADRRIVDAVDGSFAMKPPPTRRDVLTLYWPLPWSSARFTIVAENDWQAYAEIGAQQIKRALAVAGVASTDVAAVRMTRWGHAMPYAQPGQIADGIAELVRRPIAERIWFVNQDNWLLPAIETCLQEAMTFTDQIRARL
ncbi:MAG: NAD(P)-binding protein [Phycisphaerae bacterium]|nr:NAD(P)-binding protein [Phycisphaerae bacterium]